MVDAVPLGEAFDQSLDRFELGLVIRRALFAEISEIAAQQNIRSLETQTNVALTLV